MRNVARPLAVAAVVCGGIALATACAPPQQPVSAEVDLRGTLSGDDWRAFPRATVTSDVENSQYYVVVTVEYAGDQRDNRTPILSTTVTTPTNSVECETSRSFIWSSFAAGSTMDLTLWCDGVIIPNEIDEIRPLTLAE
ncbi:hypothetical protein [Microbacterium sp. NPDC077184]|uniref:hypothetical protein n=1 Tax=Microbacterium sp. NPDC077184 TaxID=3154764 RepID=UPI00343C91D8